MDKVVSRVWCCLTSRWTLFASHRDTFLRKPLKEQGISHWVRRTSFMFSPRCAKAGDRQISPFVSHTTFRSYRVQRNIRVADNFSVTLLLIARSIPFAYVIPALVSGRSIS